MRNGLMRTIDFFKQELENEKKRVADDQFLYSVNESTSSIVPPGNV